ncbi:MULTISPECIES: hypothetical protein [Aureimonas]|uniref:Uncharacterized protein n=1 Tax=Aureimonas pseudogalii TaxID=1744844 RepID=A0A7W6EHN9_9HYPH|nr:MULTISPECIES: hypothetical protein [Aureimonas]KQT64151.1 hypothetical protein ASG62_03910 [Aureimonas sp. Leaf427]KQT81340.1 hypothetical protein ASG54_01180 [Aureimonas sp. Leaf460]MBB3998399.1 hypothetical protein [Aureimonas pseudogalii]
MDIEKDLTPSREGDRPPYADRWHTLSDWMRVNMRSKDPRYWTAEFPHEVTGTEIEGVAGVPRGWTVQLFVIDSDDEVRAEVRAFFFAPDRSVTVSVVQMPDDIAARKDFYRRYIWEPHDLAAEMWERREARAA